ncbi:MAG: biotin--[acetyl-CoA-carboxylase] ligase [Clostridiales bacterium]|nr:biotin--[acetyl-CoA-carboxylase] ligase [Candidatus Blautia equi]
MTVKSRLLELLEQHKGETLSGEEIAKEMNCTRAAIWKAVKALREEGYTIDAGQNRGYSLTKENNRLSIEGIRLFLRSPEVYIQFPDTVPSTNQAAKRAAISGEAGHGSFVLARSQSAGRGRRGRQFYSPEESGLYLSVILEPKGNLQESLLLTTAAATAVYRAVKKICGIDLDIKWVNDLYLNGKKVCGILTEAITDFESGDIEFAIVGIGLNLYEDPEGFPEELRHIAGGIFPDKYAAMKADRNALVAEIVNQLLDELDDLHISEEYLSRNIVPGRQISILDGDRSREAFAIKICEDGRLLVREADGTETMLSFGEVSVRI